MSAQPAWEEGRFLDTLAGPFSRTRSPGALGGVLGAVWPACGHCSAHSAAVSCVLAKVPTGSEDTAGVLPLQLVF